MMTTQPAISIPALDYDRLTAMAEGVARVEPHVADFLLQELSRASITSSARDTRIVTMGCHVRFRDETTGHDREAQLVYPERADADANRISVLTPVGAALIGLSEGQTMQWRTRDGKMKSLTVLKVRPALESIPPDARCSTV